jgi:uncharacterized membrane protein YeaQ/YmgE (transglycosylase-associated protein family)
MNPLIWLGVGVVLGWLACVELRPALARDRVVNVIAGACGAILSGTLLATALGPDIAMAGELRVGNLIGAAFGAVLVLVLVNLVRLIRMP